MFNINECPALRCIFFRTDKWPTQPPAPGIVSVIAPVLRGVSEFIPYVPKRRWYPALAGTATDLYCVGYMVDENGIASITVIPVRGKSRDLCKEIVRGKHAAGKTFETVTVPNRIAESVVLGAKYFLLTRERP